MADRDKTNAREDELDRFWDIDALLPKRKFFPKSEKTDTTEVEVPSRDSVNSHEAVREQPIPKRDVHEKTVVHSVAPIEISQTHHYVYPQSAQEMRRIPKPDDEYVPECALIHDVKIYRWKSSYQYYEDFVKTAEKLQTVRGVACQPVKFFSYVPQYSQMTRSQFGWYLWFRECARRGEYPDTDYSYILLYAYEIINLSETLDPTEGQAQLLGLWLHYRDAYRQLDSYFPDWICDYSLIHHLPPPTDLNSEVRAALMQRCGLKEFYVGGDSEDGYLQALLIFCSNYDYKKSKFFTSDTKDLFERVMKEALRQATRKLSEDGKLFSVSGMEDSKLTRDAYSGALCSYRMKRKLEVTYCSFSRSHELRFLITDILKYTENKIRGALGVRSKLTIYALPTSIRDLIDSVAEPMLPQKVTPEKRRSQAEEAGYAVYYDVPKTPLSLSHASEIEQDSWNTTQKLVDAFETDPPLELEPLLEFVEKPVLSDFLTPASSSEDDLHEVLSPYKAFLSAVLQDDVDGQKREAKLLGKMLDAVAEEINELAADAMGDVLLENADSGYCVIEDYRTLLNNRL